jgi:hypothetical protein
MGALLFPKSSVQVRFSKKSIPFATLGDNTSKLPLIHVSITVGCMENAPVFVQ